MTIRLANLTVSDFNLIIRTMTKRAIPVRINKVRQHIKSVDIQSDNAIGWGTWVENHGYDTTFTLDIRS